MTQYNYCVRYCLVGITLSIPICDSTRRSLVFSKTTQIEFISKLDMNLCSSSLHFCFFYFGPRMFQRYLFLGLNCPSGIEQQKCIKCEIEEQVLSGNKIRRTRSIKVHKLSYCNYARSVAVVC